MNSISIFVPVKGTSERIANKNLKLLDGKPLFLHTLEKLLCMPDVDIFLDTESSEVIKLAGYLDNLNILKRDISLATNSTDGNKLFINEVKSCDHKIIVQHLCTSPFISLETIRKSISLIGTSSASGGYYDSSVLVRKEKIYAWQDGHPLYNINHIPNSKDLPDTIIETMGLYAVERSSALSTNRRIGTNPAQVIATPLESTDVNWPEDFELAQLIAAGYREKHRQLFTNISLILSSALLSDLLDDLGYNNQVIKSISKCSISGVKVLGPAKTLKLRPIRADEDFRGIYNALHHYETLVPGDILCVENDVSSYAYFGELNANLAIRQGVKAVIVDGMTRDTPEVIKTGLPVFARGYTCQDVRGRAVLDTMNQKIKIDNVIISPGDLLFGDQEGIVVIPKLISERVFSLIQDRFRNERSIVSDIASGVNISDILSRRGDF